VLTVVNVAVAAVVVECLLELYVSRAAESRECELDLPRSSSQGHTLNEAVQEPKDDRYGNESDIRI